MKTKIKNLLLLIIALICSANSLFSQTNNSNLIISEILYNPPGTDSIEFIEFYNPLNNNISLNGYSLSGPFKYNFPDVVVEPNGYFVIAKDSVIMRKHLNTISYDWGSGSLANTTKTITVKDSNGDIVDEVTYYNTEPWPVIKSSGGPSIELNRLDSDNNDGSNWKLSTTFGVVLNNGDTLFCSPGKANLPYLPDADFNVTERILFDDGNATFENLSFGNNLTYDWLFEGGTPNSSNLENPTINYSNLGFYDVTLTASNSDFSNTLTKESYIAVLPSECTLLSNLPINVSFNTTPECWIFQPKLNNNIWEIDNTIGYNDNYSLKLNCSNFDNNKKAKIISNGLDLNNYENAFLSFYYKGTNITEINNINFSINVYDNNINLLETFIVENTIVEDWNLFSTQLPINSSYIEFVIINNNNIETFYIDEILISDTPIDKYVLSGKITNNNIGVSNIDVLIGDSILVTTNNDGNYLTYVPNGWSGIVKPNNINYLFNPDYYEIRNITENNTELNFNSDKLPDGWGFETTYGSHTFCIIDNTFLNENVSINSWIGLFYLDSETNNEVCCGAIKYTGESSFCFNGYTKDIYTNINGFSNNDSIIWKLFDIETNNIIDVVPNYLSGPTNYVIDGLTTIDNFTTIQETHLLLIPKGWSSISSLVIPNNLSLEELLLDVSQDVIVLLNDIGVYMPGTNYHTIENWDPESGWLIKTDNNVNLEISGFLNENLNVHLNKGWTLIPVKSFTDVDVNALFGNNLSDIDIIKGYDLNEVFIPNITEEFSLKSGKAYKIRMKNESNINFANSKGNSLVNNNHNNYTPKQSPFENEVNLTTNSHVLVFSSSNLEDNDIIGAFNKDDLCVGIGLVNKNKTVFCAYGNDTFTNVIDGLQINEEIKFILFRNNEYYNLTVGFASNTINDNHFVVDGITYIDKVILHPIGIEDIENDLYIYPNPTTGLINIINNNNFHKCYIYNITGEIVDTFILNKNINTIDISNYIKGTYILKLTDNKENEYKKIIKL